MTKCIQFFSSQGKSNKFSWKEAKKQQKQNLTRSKDESQNNKKEGQGNVNQSENNSLNKPQCPW